MCNRHIKHLGLKEFLLSRRLWENIEVTHHLQPVGNLDDRHPRVGRILHYELLVVFRFQPRILGLDGRNLVESIDHSPYVLRESADIYVLVRSCRLVQIHSRNTLRRQTNLVLHDERNSVSVTEKRTAVIAGLIPERLCRNGARSCDQ